jgi:chloride channel protein, CIC family
MASLFTGLLIGVVGGFFQLSLVAADHLRNAAVIWARAWPSVGWLVPLGIGVIGAALARLLVVRFAPEAEGSGVQRVEADFSGEVKPATRFILPVKFFGGIIAIGSGLALGREGPTVQMGSTLARLLSRFLITDDAHARVVDAAGAGAGLAVAFNDEAEFRRNFEDAPAYQCLWSSSDPSLHGRDARQMIRHFRVAQDGLRKKGLG